MPLDVAGEAEVRSVCAVLVNFWTNDLMHECLRTLLDSAEGVRLQVVVVDNSQEAGLEATVHGLYPSATVIVSPQNVGFAQANNLAIGACGSQAILFLNPDVRMAGTAVRDLAGFLSQCPAAAAVGPRLVRPTGEMDRACRRSFPDPATAFYRLSGLGKLLPGTRFDRYNLGGLGDDRLHEIDSGSGACLMVRTSALGQIGGLDPDFFMYGEDLDLCYRLRRLGWKIYYQPSAEAVHLKGRSSMRATVAMLREFHRSMWIFYRKHYYPDRPRLLSGLVWLGIWARYWLLRLRHAVTHDPRVSV